MVVPFAGHAVTLEMVKPDARNSSFLHVELGLTDGFTNMPVFFEDLPLVDGGSGTLEYDRVGLFIEKASINRVDVDFGTRVLETTLQTVNGELAVRLSIEAAHFTIMNGDGSPLAVVEEGTFGILTIAGAEALVQMSIEVGQSIIPYEATGDDYPICDLYCLTGFIPTIYVDSFESVEVSAFPSGFPNDREHFFQIVGAGSGLLDAGNGLHAYVGFYPQFQRMTFVPAPEPSLALSRVAALAAIVTVLRRHRRPGHWRCHGPRSSARPMKSEEKEWRPTASRSQASWERSLER